MVAKTRSEAIENLAPRHFQRTGGTLAARELTDELYDENGLLR